MRNKTLHSRGVCDFGSNQEQQQHDPNKPRWFLSEELSPFSSVEEQVRLLSVLHGGSRWSLHGLLRCPASVSEDVHVVVWSVESIVANVVQFIIIIIIIIIKRQRADRSRWHVIIQWNNNIETTVRRNVNLIVIIISNSMCVQSVLLKRMNWVRV